MIDHTKMTIRGTTLIVPGESVRELVEFALYQNWEQFAIANDDGFTMSHPLSEKERIAYTWLFHRMAVKDAETPPEPPKTPPKGPTPPTGGTPAAGRQEEPQELLLAVA